ncbi:DUF4479 and tRNA-binding domain-containing protein [Carnobacteriaceae bacterium zg-84]|uniref:YtpR family tRNA-binding protein n=1 Tax=Granulicatella sp. zg-84 TaxID=2678503 RepID=UPI0013C170EA|nr:DUF4479 and tRNA-binding domain-containing protein [Granulicatella sp. zg-84]NEW65855.1 DUF4479 domain-containing protein [Granulicatella sp. zg-84]QMI86392.1 DUF4479 and tRNA-binding domain-containing protein [Carnobacteriaceae bacterium zg-84]
MMFLAFYNKEHVGDTLLLVRKETDEPVDFERVDDVTRVFIKETNETVAYNIFNISEKMTLEGHGQVLLRDDQVVMLNELLSKYQWETITVDNTPKFVIGHVDTCVDHTDSDHLHVTTVSVGQDKPLQIVCGAPNVEVGQRVVVAKVGAVMPSGMIIWDGELRGIASQGMLCSARELQLPNAPDKRGILVLDEGIVGQPFPLV